MLRIRLKRVGRKHDPSYRVIITEKHRGPKSGKYIESIGSYDPRIDKRDIDVERAKHWISVGAQPSDTVHNIFVTEKIIDAKKINVLPQKSPVKSEQPEKEETEKVEEKAGEKAGESEDEKAVEETPTESDEKTPSEEAVKEPEEDEGVSTEKGDSSGSSEEDVKKEAEAENTKESDKKESGEEEKQ